MTSIFCIASGTVYSINLSLLSLTSYGIQWFRITLSDFQRKNKALPTSTEAEHRFYNSTLKYSFNWAIRHEQMHNGLA